MMAAAASVAYDDKVYESPPNVAEAPASEGHTLSTEEFDETPSAPTTNSFMPIKDAIIEASKYRTGDETKKMTARSIFRLVNYACFLVLVTYVALIQSSVQTYYFTNILSNLFVTSKTSPSRKAFVDIGTMDDIWGFLEVEFLTSLYDSDGPFTVGEEAMVYYNNKLLGRPRIRMLKVTNNSCTVISSFSREITECFSNFSPAAEDRQTFGPGNSEAYVWQSASVLMTETITGTITSYTGGGFLLQLPLDDSAKALKLLEGVKSNRWIDRGTRALIIDFSMFNANSNLFSIARLLLELPASGGVLPSYRFNTYNLMRYYGSFGNVLIILEGILVGFIIFYIFEKILELIRLRLRYFGKFWDIVDIVLLTLCSCEVYFNYRRLTIAANRINTSLKSGLTVAAFDEVVSTQETFNNIAAVVLFLSWIKNFYLNYIKIGNFHLFNYIGINKTMNQLAETLSRSAKDIGGFAVMFAVFFFAYAQFGYLVFGTQIADYSTFLDSVFALLRTVLGDFDFTALQQTNRVLGPLFFVTYVFFVFFVLLNMFLAIINDSYTEVKAELARQKEGYGVFDWIRMKLTRGKKEDKKFTTYNDYKIDLMMAGYNEKDITDALDKCNVGLDDEVNDEVLVELGNEIRDQVQRKKLIDEEYRSTAVLTHRIDMMDNAIFNVVEKLSKTIEQLNRIEYSKVLVKEHQNQLKADEILFNARLEDGLAEDVEDNKED